MTSHLDFVLLANKISEKISGCCAHLYVTTVPTPPAPIINTLDIY